MRTKLEKIEALMTEEKKGELINHLWDTCFDLDLEGEQERGLEFRLQVPSLESDEILIHTGDSQYDLDHSGFWGAGYLPIPGDAKTAIEDAWEEVMEDCTLTLEEN